MSLERVSFFGLPDRKGKSPNGPIASEIPGWYHDNKLDLMKEEAALYRRMIAAGNTSPDNIPQLRAHAEMLDGRIKEIENSKPKLTGADRDDLGKVYKEVSKEIGDSMPSRTDMMKGLADPHEEVRRMTEPCIKLSENGAAMAVKLGFRPDESGKVNRNEAARIFQFSGKLLGEPTNIESLRRDFAHGTYKGDVPLSELR